MSTMNSICKEGIVNTVTMNRVTVKITQPAACNTCHAKSACTAVESAEKIIDARAVGTLYQGDAVILEMEEKMGWIAVLYTFIFPFICLIIGLVIGYLASGSEGIGALISILTLPLYYGVLYLFKERITRDFVFLARKKYKH